MEKKAVWLDFNGSRDLGTESEDSPHASERVDAHAKIDDDEVRIGGQVHRSSVNPASHVSLLQQFPVNDSRSNSNGRAEPQREFLGLRAAGSSASFGGLR